jgi:hypothetical protein
MKRPGLTHLVAGCLLATMASLATTEAQAGWRFTYNSGAVYVPPPAPVYAYPPPAGYVYAPPGYAYPPPYAYPAPAVYYPAPVVPPISVYWGGGWGGYHHHHGRCW